MPCWLMAKTCTSSEALRMRHWNYALYAVIMFAAGVNISRSFWATVVYDTHPGGMLAINLAAPPSRLERRTMPFSVLSHPWAAATQSNWDK